MVQSRWHLRPTTRAGIWTAAFLGGFVTAFGVMNVAAVAGQTGGDRISDNWWLAGPAVIAGGCALGGLAFGSYAVARRGERSPVVLLAVVVGLIVAVFMAGEAVAPH